MKTIIEKSVSDFWTLRKGGEGVRTGKTLEPFIAALISCIDVSTRNHFKFLTSNKDTILPGVFRESKRWDLIIRYGDVLVGAIELKSQVGSLGNNFNNRAEEALGSGLDLNWLMLARSGNDPLETFIGYITLVEDDALYKNKTSYVDRYDRLCTEMMRRKIYDSASVIAVDRIHQGNYRSISANSSLEMFVKRFEQHLERYLLSIKIRNEIA